MQKEDYIENIAAYIVEDWNAADAGNQASSSTAKCGVMRIAKQAAEEQFRAADLY